MRWLFPLFPLLAVASHAENLVDTEPVVQGGVAVGYESPAELAEKGPAAASGAEGGRIWVQVMRGSDRAAAPSNFQVQVLNTAGKEITRAMGDNAKPYKDQEQWVSFVNVKLAAPWDGPLTVKVHERGNAKLLTYVSTRKPPGKPEGGPKEPGLEEAGFAPWEIENWKKKGRKNPQPTGDQGSKQFEAGGEVKEVLLGALLMPGDTGPWILKGYPRKDVKAGQFVLCKTVQTPERFTYKTPDGKESKLWIYSFVDWMSYPN